MIECFNPYVLPTIEFVGGETQELLFNMYFYQGKKPFSMVGCISSFSIVSFNNKNGSPILRKDSTSLNVLSVELTPEETYKLSGKYIYQISIKDVSGNIEIPKQGLMYIINNINKGFITS